MKLANFWSFVEKRLYLEVWKLMPIRRVLKNLVTASFKLRMHELEKSVKCPGEN